MYNSKTGEVTKLVSEELPEDYVKTVSAVVKNKFNISAAIITEDYYSYLKEYSCPASSSIEDFSIPYG